VSAKNSSLSRPARGRKNRIVAGLEHQHGVRLAVAAQAGEVGERAVRAEDVVGVVAAHLQPARGDDEPVAGERLADRGPALRGIRRGGGRLGRGRSARGPVLGDERPELVGGGTGAVLGLLLLFAGHRPIVA
jgi:hypothetical protein